jgi:hypothetical protein
LLLGNSSKFPPDHMACCMRSMIEWLATNLICLNLPMPMVLCFWTQTMQDRWETWIFERGSLKCGHEVFVEGKFVVQRSGKKFSIMALNEIQEHSIEFWKKIVESRVFSL